MIQPDGTKSRLERLSDGNPPQNVSTVLSGHRISMPSLTNRRWGGSSVDLHVVGCRALTDAVETRHFAHVPLDGIKTEAPGDMSRADVLHPAGRLVGPLQ